MDYCTMFPEGWWAHCCEAHDLAYSAQVDRLAADLDLFQCLAATGDAWMYAASVAIGGLMFLGVRVFGGRFYRRAA